MSLKHKLDAYHSLWSRYREIFGFHWKHRHSFDSKLFNTHEAEFLPAALSLQEKPVSPTARLVAKILMALVVSAIVWSVIGKTDIIVNATGKVLPSERVKTIESVDVANVKALHVQEGQSVKAGDLLIELDTSAPDAEQSKATTDETTALLQMARSKALIEAIERHSPPVLPSIPGLLPAIFISEQKHLTEQYQDFMAKLNQIEGDIRRYEEELPIAEKTANDYKDLSNTHDVSTHAYLEKEQAKLDLQGELSNAQHKKSALIEETKRTAYDTLSEGQKVSADSKEDAFKAKVHSKMLKLIAPVDGTVQQLTVHTIGGVVPAAQPLMIIVPKKNSIEVEAQIEDKDIGFIKDNQHAEIKIDAFEYTKYGTIPGRIKHISQDAITDEKKGLLYIAKIIPDRSTININGKMMPLSSGMSVNVEIKTGERHIIEYVLSPLLQHAKESLHER